MPFRFWFYLAQLSNYVLLPALAITFVFPSNSFLASVRFVLLSYFLLLGLTGAVMGILLACDRLRMLCPFCGKSGPVGGNKRDGLWMLCELCGFIHGSGPLHLKIVREPIDSDVDSRGRIETGQSLS